MDTFNAAELEVFFREYLYQKKWQKQKEVPWRTPGQYPFKEVRFEVIKQIKLFIKISVPEYRWDEVFKFCWGHLHKKGYFKREVTDTSKYLQELISEYLRTHPRKYRLIDETGEKQCRV